MPLLLGPEVNRKDKLLAESRKLELFEETENVVIPTDPSVVPSQPSSICAFWASGRRTLPCTKQNSEDTTTIVINNTIHKLFIFITCLFLLKPVFVSLSICFEVYVTNYMCLASCCTCVGPNYELLLGFICTCLPTSW